jgi:hypothetical protein
MRVMLEWGGLLGVGEISIRPFRIEVKVHLPSPSNHLLNPVFPL